MRLSSNLYFFPFFPDCTMYMCHNSERETNKWLSDSIYLVKRVRFSSQVQVESLIFLYIHWLCIQVVQGLCIESLTRPIDEIYVYLTFIISASSHFFIHFKVHTSKLSFLGKHFGSSQYLLL